MKKALLIASILFASSSHALVSVSADANTCANVNAAVQQHGEALVFWTSKFTGNELYEKVYASRCPEMGYSTYNFWVDTADMPDCFAGYICGPQKGG